MAAPADLTFSGTNFGNVISFDPKPIYPCMDSAYKELTITVETEKTHASINAMLTFETSTIDSLFDSGSRTASLSYKSVSESDMFLQTFERVGNPDEDILTGTVYAKYRLVLTKEDA